MTHPAPDNAALKERERQTWSSIADGWRRRHALLRKGAAPVTERMLDLASIGDGHHVLDIASGTGEPAISAAHRIGMGGKVIGTDLVEEMLAHAREHAGEAELENIEFRCTDGEELELAAAVFDAVTIRWGLMFMPDPVACLARARRMLKPGGKLVAACWAEPERNPFIGVVMGVLARYMDIPRPPPGAPGIFALADPERLAGVFDEAGFTDVHIEDITFDVIEVDNATDYWAAFADLAGPVMVLVDQLGESERAAFVEEAIRAVDALHTEGTLRMSGTTWIAAGVR